MAALRAQKVPFPFVFRFLTVNTGDIHDKREFRRNGLHLNSGRRGTPGGEHPFPRFGRLFADGVATVMHRQLPKTFQVDRVSARHFVRSAAKTEQILLADATIAPVLTGLAIVGIIEGPVNAHAAFRTVLKVFLASDAAKAAVGTVIRLLLVRHLEVTNDLVMVVAVFG